MKLICELVEDVQTLIVEAEGKKNLYIEGIFLQGNIKNRNGRIYDADTLEKEVGRYVKENVEKKRAWGELNHPSGPTINLDKVCVMHESVKRVGDNFIGRSKVLTDLPMGQIVEGLINAGGCLGVSSRGMGSLKMVEGVMRVQDDFRLATLADVVSDPSAHDAFVQGIFEGANWLYDPISGMWTEAKVEQIAENIKQKSSKEIEANKLQLFEAFFNSLTNKKR